MASMWDLIRKQMRGAAVNMDETRRLPPAVSGVRAPAAADALIDPWAKQLPPSPYSMLTKQYAMPPAAVATPVAARAVTKPQQKVFADAAKEYQSNSMPVLMQPQGPTKGGAAMRPQINWGTNQQGYDTMGDFGGNAADLLRADAMRKKMMEAGMGGLLG